jgi:hypothetical protein
MRAILVVSSAAYPLVVTIVLAANPRPGPAVQARVPAAVATAQDCVAITKPQPSAGYTYQHVDSTGRRSRYTDQWETVTDTGSRVRTTRDGGTTVQVNRYHLANDVVVLEESTKLTGSGDRIDSTVFSPGIVLDPGLHACAGRSWRIPSVTASYRSTHNSASAASPAGTLRIVAIRELVTVPAGKFATVHYIRTSQSSDDYWKSIEHGVVVKHVGKLPGAVVSEVLLSIN